MQTNAPSPPAVAPPDSQGYGARLWPYALCAILLLALGLRLHGLHDPILDHPGWRQGDTASIARNFARLRYDIMYPQTTYNGAPPHYVELELQILPFLAATLYKFFGVHPIFGRLIAIAFSLGTIVVLAAFGRWLFASRLAGLGAAFAYAVFPGALYYGRTFTPDGAMVFFLTAALYAVARLLLEDPTLAPRALARTTALLTFAYLAKPVAVAGLLVVVGLLWERRRAGHPTRPTAALVLLAVPLLILWIYDRRVTSYAEWHWASGITQLHVLPALRAALTTPAGFALKLQQLRTVFDLLRATMLGPIGLVLTAVGFALLPSSRTRSTTLLWAWLVGGALYAYAVVTVERVDYYLLLLLPMAALAVGAVLYRFVATVRGAVDAPAPRRALLVLPVAVALAMVSQGRAAVAPYYHYSRSAYRGARTLDRLLPRRTLVVIGHYGPDLQYYVDRFGWEEDPKLWTPFDEESAIRKGARYFIAVEANRLDANLELCAWLQRFPLVDRQVGWPVYHTDLRDRVAGYRRFWRTFRRAEARGQGRRFLDRHGVCTTGAALKRRA